VNDPLLHRRPWLAGPTALASVLSSTDEMTVATTIALAVVRGPVPLAKSLAAIDLLSGGHLVVGVGPGSYRPDYEVGGIEWDERWPRFEEAIQALRALWRPDGDPFEGEFSSTRGIRLEPEPAQAGGPPIWIGSWGSDAGLRRVARLGDGWLASAYNTSPGVFAEAWAKLREQLRSQGKAPEAFPNALATMMFRVEDDPKAARRALEEWVSPALGRDPEELGDRLLVAPAEECAERLARYAEAGSNAYSCGPLARRRSSSSSSASRWRRFSASDPGTPVPGSSAEHGIRVPLERFAIRRIGGTRGTQISRSSKEKWYSPLWKSSRRRRLTRKR